MMQVHNMTSPLPAAVKKAVVAIGNFDAVHRGHQALLAMAREVADRKSAHLAVMTFEPHPRRLFRPDDPPFRVTPLMVKCDRFKKAGVDHVYVVPFDWNLAGLSAEKFITTILRGTIDPVTVVVGNDFHFGHNRAGNVDALREQGIETIAVPLAHDNHRGIVSATRVRGLIQSGHIDEANDLLGWPWEIRGVVGHGDKRGREIGYPTANIPLGETIHPAYGVYATWVQVVGHDVWHRSATNIGIRPMFEVATALIESHILDFQGDLYGKEVRVRPVAKIRDEMKFPSLDALIAQIEEDCQTARSLL